MGLELGAEISRSSLGSVRVLSVGLVELMITDVMGSMFWDVVALVEWHEAGNKFSACDIALQGRPLSSPSPKEEPDSSSGCLGFRVGV